MRGSAAETLGKLGAAARVAVPDLARLLKDPEVFVRQAAAMALGGIGPAAKERAGNNFPEFSQSRLSCGKVS